MKIEIGPAAIGNDGIDWGTTAAGLPVLLIRERGRQVQIEMERVECKELGVAAIYMALASALEHGDGATAKPASLLVDASGVPL